MRPISGGFQLSDPTYLKNLKAFGRGEPTEADICSLESEMYSGPDRGAAVVLGSMVERSLGQLLRNNMRTQGVNELFEYNGPMGSFSAMTQVAYAFKLIGPKVRSDLNIVRHIRNQFAHSRRPIRFTTVEVREACKHLQLPDEPGVHLNFRMLNSVSAARLRQASDKSHPRTRYFTSCNEIAQRIYFVRTGDPSAALNQLP